MNRAHVLSGGQSSSEIVLLEGSCGMQTFLSRSSLASIRLH